MNPYDFVRIDPTTHVDRQQPRDHDRFSGVTGRIEGTITTLTPLFIPSRKTMSPKRFQTNGQGQYIIPGSSLKGLIRSLVETLGPGCWWLIRNEAKRSLPREYQPCLGGDRLCVACRMFGLISGNTHLEGHVRFGDAVCAQPESYQPIYTPILDGPKLRHNVWYFNGPNGSPTGRKYYFHSETIRTAQNIRKSSKGVELNQYIAPIGPNSVFTFTAHFDSLDGPELQLLYYALTLEPTMRHKIGYAKPAGLGSIEIAFTRIETLDMQQRYLSPAQARQVYEGDRVPTYIADQTAQFVADRTSVTLTDLRRIWQWPPPANVEYGYPTRDWFDENPEAPISATRNAPIQR